MNPLYKKALTVLGAVVILFAVHTVLHFTDCYAAPVSSGIVATAQHSGLNFGDEIMNGIAKFISFTGFRNASSGNLIMIAVGLLFIFLAIRFDYEPLLLVPIGTGIIIGNVPFFQDGGVNLQLGIYQQGSVLNYLYFGVVKGIYPPLIFLGIGAMTDFSSLISNPRLILLGAAAQVGIFLTFIGALYLGFNMPEAGAIGIIGGADGPTAIFLSSKLANGGIVHGLETKNLIGPIAIAAYSYMALVPVIQPPIMRLLTNKRERKIRMKPTRAVSRQEKIIFPIHFMRTLFPGCRRNRKSHLWKMLHQTSNNGGLACPRRSGDRNHFMFYHRHYKAFRTCSLIFSSSSFMRTTIT